MIYPTVHSHTCTPLQWHTHTHTHTHMFQVPYHWPTNITSQCTKFGHPGDLATRVCASLSSIVFSFFTQRKKKNRSLVLHIQQVQWFILLLGM